MRYNLSRNPYKNHPDSADYSDYLESVYRGLTNREQVRVDALFKRAANLPLIRPQLERFVKLIRAADLDVNRAEGAAEVFFNVELTGCVRFQDLMREKNG